MKRLALAAAALAVAACTAKEAPRVDAPQPQYRPLAAGAKVSFSVVKNGDTPVAGAFTDVTGKIDVARWPALGGAVQVGLRSLETGVPARTDNVVRYFFGATEAASSSATFRPARWNGPAVSLDTLAAPVEGTLEGVLEVAGGAVPVALPVTLTTAPGGAIAVESAAPAEVSIAALGMADDKERLMEVCKHKSVSDEVAVSIAATLAASAADR